VLPPPGRTVPGPQKNTVYDGIWNNLLFQTEGLYRFLKARIHVIHEFGLFCCFK
jgi:hypothetical protein